MEEGRTQIAVVDGLRCAYVHAGSGPVVMLLHGWAQSKRSWRDIVPELAHEYSVYAIDLPGFGESETQPRAWAISEYAAFVDEFAKSLSLEVYAVIGHSFGARVAAAYADRFPLKRLVLCSMGKIAGGSIFRSLNSMLIRLIGPIAPQWLYQLHRSALSPRGYEDGSAGSREHARKMLAIYLTTHQSMKVAPKIKIPSLLLYGKRDPITPAWIGSRMSQDIPGSHFVAMRHAGHFVHIDARPLFVELVRKFLKN